MKKTLALLLPILFIACNKDDFDKEHSQHIIGKWRWVKTEVHHNFSFNNPFNEYTPESTGSTFEIEFKENGTTKFHEDGQRIRYLEKSSNLILNQLFGAFTSSPYYIVSTSYRKTINHQKNFANCIPVAYPDSLYSGYFPTAVTESEGFTQAYYAKSIFIKIE